jgi:hypothetical protein
VIDRSNRQDLPVKRAQIEPKKAKEELKPFYTNFGTGMRAHEKGKCHFRLLLGDPGRLLVLVVLSSLAFLLLSWRLSSARMNA